MESKLMLIVSMLFLLSLVTMSEAFSGRFLPPRKHPRAAESEHVTQGSLNRVSRGPTVGALRNRYEVNVADINEVIIKMNLLNNAFADVVRSWDSYADSEDFRTPSELR